jgi:predicted Ser/Thr protein kinase
VRYESAVLVGRGGVGEVYRAYDPAVGRHVALKYLLEDDDALVERFLREARLQARVDDERVCRVYEVGRDHGRPFIAMQYVDGITLEDGAAALTADDRLRLVALVAEAVHAAHEVGIVHRDLKPQNVMLEKSGGTWRPYVMDFGLAREHAAPGLTRTGVVLGTPGYLSPEQARGDPALDRRTDVYALGCILFRLFAGRPPFEGGDLKAAARAVEEDAPPLRRFDPTVSADLQTIVGRCLEKEPGRRYATALELAQDLGRVRAGAAIAARAPTWIARLGRRLRRNPRLAAVSVAAVAVMGTAALLAVAARRQTRQQTAAAERFGQEAESVEASLREAHLLPLHDTRLETGRVRQRMLGLEGEMALLGAMALGPGHHALGRGYLALGQYQEARRHLETAWRGGYQAATVAYALGRSLAALYQRALEEMTGLQSATLRAARRREIETALRDPALRYLRAGSPSPGEPQAYVEGLLALHGRHYDAALRQAQAAFEQAPWLYEAKILAGDVHIALGRDALEGSAYDAALAEYDRAGASFEAAALVARSDPTVYERDCYRLDLTVYVRRLRGLDARDAIERGARACGTALAADPEHPRAAMRLCNLLWQQGDVERSAGQDPTATFDRAVALGENATRWEPTQPRNWRSLGLALYRKADYEAEAGRDPRLTYDRAIASVRTGLRYVTDDPPALVNLAAMLMARGRYDMSQQLDPRPALDEAVHALETAARAQPEDGTSRATRGIVHLTRGEYETAHGEDPRPSFARAVAAYDEALRVSPGDPRTHYNRSGAWVETAAYEVAHGLNPAASLAQAVQSAARAGAANPMIGGAQATLGDVAVLRALYALKTDDDPRPYVREAEAAYRRSIALERGYSYMHVARARAHAIEAEYALVHGEDALPAVVRGLRTLRTARRLDADVGRLEEGQLQLLRARSAIASGASPEDALASAAACLAVADTDNPRRADVLLAVADLHRRQAEWALGRGSQTKRAAEIRAGLGAADAGLQVKGDSAGLHAVRAALLELEARDADDEEARARRHAAAETAYARALALDPWLEPAYRR